MADSMMASRLASRLWALRALELRRLVRRRRAAKFESQFRSSKSPGGRGRHHSAIRDRPCSCSAMASSARGEGPAAADASDSTPLRTAGQPAQLERQERTPLVLHDLITEGDDYDNECTRRHMWSVFCKGFVHFVLVLIAALALTWLAANKNGPVTTAIWFVAGIYLGAAVVRPILTTLAWSAKEGQSTKEHGGILAWRRFSRPSSDSFNEAISVTEDGSAGGRHKTKKSSWIRSILKTMNKAKESSSSAVSSTFASTDSWFSDRFQKMRYTTLAHARGRPKAHWERHVSDAPSEAMQERLLKNRDFRTRPSQYPLQQQGGDESTCTSMMEEGTLLPVPPAENGQNSKFGTFDTTAMYASVMHKTVRQREIDPIFILRGMDIFRSVGLPEERIFRQPILEKGGLRDVPTFVINAMLPLCNLVVYFEMPEWVKRFDDIPDETENDPPDMKALKRFLRGDDSYRRPRFKVLASVIDGPWVVRSLSPQKGEIVFDFNDWLKLSWHKEDERIDPVTGKKRAAMLSVDIDSMGDSVARKVLSLVQGSIQKVKLDCAVIISKPAQSKVEEPSACIGLWRMDRIDMHQTSLLPEKDERLLLKEASAKLKLELQ